MAQKPKTLFLTFDDGPNEPYTSQILEILNRYGARATFFVCGANAEKFPQTLKKIADGGHAIGIHSYSHSRLKTLLGTLVEEVAKMRQLIQKFAGVDTQLYRSPWGITMPWLKRKLLAQGYRIYRWNIMAFDWLRPDPKFITGHIVKRSFPGAVILLHDGGETHAADRANTVAALPEILSELGRQGYSFLPLNQNSLCRESWCDAITDNWQGLNYYVKTRL